MKDSWSTEGCAFASISASAHIYSYKPIYKCLEIILFGLS